VEAVDGVVVVLGNLEGSKYGEKRSLSDEGYRREAGRDEVSRKEGRGGRLLLLITEMIGMDAARIGWEPALLDASLLLEDFENAPEAGECEDAQNGGEDVAVEQERRGGGEQSHDEEYPPAAGAEVVLGFDDDGVEHSYEEECRQTYDETGKIHNIFSFRKLAVLGMYPFRGGLTVKSSFLPEIRRQK
jgi:hypothetical protein